MDRREFVGTSVLGTLGAAWGGVSEFAPPQARGGAPATASLHQLGRTLNPDDVAGAYAGATRGAISNVPYVYAYYDEQKKLFVSPTDIVPTLESGTCTLDAKLHAFNVKSVDREKFSNLQSEVQLGMNVSAPSPIADRLTWLFMSAVSVFLEVPNKQGAALTTFVKNSNGVPLKTMPKVTVEKGVMTLQVTALGQKKNGFWRKFIDVIAAGAASPIAAPALKGFGLPCLAAEAVRFLGHTLDTFEDQEKLTPLWSTGGLDFGVLKGSKERFKMVPGLWVMIDASYARASNFLEGHTVDLSMQSFLVSDGRGAPVDANYLVADFALEPSRGVCG